ncbi:MAG: hypothetical protein H7257_12670 [Taibaiella sp.]|nr:hypothetical protein [Taibaiella sp.]
MNIIKAATLSLATIGLLAGCKKSNTINNSQVVATPYSLYFTDSSGALYNSTDGKSAKVVFASDGQPTRAIVTINENLLWIKPSIYLSSNSGRNFNYAYDSLTSVPMVTNTGRAFNLNQSMVANVPAWNHVYVVSDNPSPENFFGMAGNERDGILGEWYPENWYDTDQIVFTYQMTITSFTLLKDNILIAYDAIHNRVFSRNALPNRWKESQQRAGLPGTPAFFSLGHYNHRVIAIDNFGASGAYFSDDTGKTWTSFTGLPAGRPLMCVASPFEEVCLVGTDSAGVYILNTNTNTFQPSNTGLAANTIVRNIAFKENIYKNGTKKQFVYLATNKGIYQSTDKGNSWVKTISGNFINIY